MERGVFEIVDTESLVPANHLLRKIDAAVDFGKIYDMVEPLYCADNGRPSVDPVVLFKMVLILLYQRMYKTRKETIERVFADAKEQHGLRYTRYTGLAQVTNWVKLKFAAMNLKKLATWKWKECFIYPLFRAVFLFLERNPAVA